MRHPFAWSVGLFTVVCVILALGPPLAAPEPVEAPTGAALVLGTVAAPTRPYGETRRTRLTDVMLGHEGAWERLSGDLLVTWTGGQRLIVGERIRLWVTARSVRPLHNPGVRDRDAVSLSRGIVMRGMAHGPVPLERHRRAPYLWRLRAAWRAALDRWLDSSQLEPDAASLVRATVLGDAGAVSRDLRDTWRRAGLGHLLAISGLHVGLIAFLIYGVSTRLFAAWPGWTARLPSSRPGACVAILGAWGYVAVSGGPTSAVRAAWMITGLLAARLLFRRCDAASAIALAALFVLIGDPRAMLDPSCQLSFAAVIALSMGLEPLRHYGARLYQELPFAPFAWLVSRAFMAFGASILCTLGTLPFVVWHFQAVPLGGLVANVLAIPLAAWGLVVPGMVALCLAPVAAHVSPVLSGLVQSWIDRGAGLLVAFARFVCSWLPPVSMSGSGVWELVLVTIAATSLLAAVALGRRRRLLVAVGATALLLAGVPSPTAAPDSGKLRVTFLAVGHGDAVVVQLPSGDALLVDAGGDAAGRRDVGADVVVPALHGLGVRSLRALVLTHPHPDHIGGMSAVLSHFDVAELWIEPSVAAHPGVARLARRLHARGGRLRALKRGDRIAVGAVRIDALHPPWPVARPLGLNDRSLVLRLRFGAFSLLLSGDVEGPAELELLSSGLPLRSTVLKVPHHGSRTSSGSGLLEAVAPELAVAQCQERGRFDFPSPAVVARYRRMGIPLWATGHHGAIQVLTDGVTWGWSTP